MDVFAADEDDVENAVQAAVKAFASWGQTDGKFRSKFIQAIAEKLKVERDRLARLSSTINGKPLFEAEIDIDDAVSTYEYYAIKAAQLDDRQETNVMLKAEGFGSYTRYEPCGVAALITPWNFSTCDIRLEDCSSVSCWVHDHFKTIQ